MTVVAGGTGMRGAYLDNAPLAPGDVVHLVGPSSPSTPEDVERAVGYLEGYGLKVRVAPHILARHDEIEFLAGTDDQRRDDLVDAWTDPEAAAVICVRGGDGAMRLLDGIDWAAMGAAALRRDGRPKLFTGSSDATALHEALRFHLGVPSLFCPMVGNDVFRDSSLIREDVGRWLLEPWGGRRIVGPVAQTMVPGRAHGIFRGGNLSRVVGALGAPEAGVSGAPEILFLEDIGENVSHLDGFMVQLVRSGRLDGVAGIVLGSWTDCGDPGPIRTMMADHLSGLGIPVLWEQGFGHDPDALSIPLNVPGVLDVDEGSVELRVDDAGAPGGIGGI